MTSALDMVAGIGTGFDPLGSFVEGREARAKLQEMKFAEKARPLMGAALQGDSNALNSLAGVNPEAFMEVSKFNKTDPASEADKIASLVNWADTPEKWEQAKQRMAANGIKLEPQEQPFEARGAMLAEYQTLKSQQDQANQNRTFDLKERDFNADEAYRGEQLAIEREKLAAPKASNKVVTDIDGQRGILDKDTGEFTPKGASPIRGKPGLSPTEFKAKRESETDLLNLEQTLTSLGEALNLAPEVFEGAGSEAMTYIGSKVPGGGMVVDSEKANKTAQYTSIMSPEAIKLMADTLKGATTDFELRKFENILSDPSQPNNIKKQVITRMLNLAKNKHELETKRLQEFDERENGGQRPQAAPEQSGQAEPGEIPSDAVAELLADPSGAAEFDEVFGAGAAARILEQQ